MQFLVFLLRITTGKWEFSTALRAVIGNYVYNNAAANSSLADITSSSYNYLGIKKKSVLTNQFSGFEYIFRFIYRRCFIP
jgi:iron complex outermembrane receptor protein